MIRRYERVLPRDLFNEAKLLKCMGQLALLLHNEVGIRWPLELKHDTPYEGFYILQDDSDGGLLVSNLKLILGKISIKLKSSLNSKRPYPLNWEIDDQRGGIVFNDDGTLDDEFQSTLDSINPDDSRDNRCPKTPSAATRQRS